MQLVQLALSFEERDKFDCASVTCCAAVKDTQPQPFAHRDCLGQALPVIILSFAGMVGGDQVIDIPPTEGCIARTH